MPRVKGSAALSVSPFMSRSALITSGGRSLRVKSSRLSRTLRRFQTTWSRQSRKLATTTMRRIGFG